MHKALCSTTINSEPRPSPDHYRAILLPENGSKPRFIWVPTESYGGGDVSDTESDSGDNDGEPMSDNGGNSGNDQEFLSIDGSNASTTSSDDDGIPDYDKEKGIRLLRLDDDDWGAESGSGGGTIQVVCGKRQSGQHLPYSIHMRHREVFFFDGSKDNQCLTYLARGKTGSCIRGPLILYAMMKVHSPCFVVNIDIAGFSIAIDALIEYARCSELGYAAMFVPKPSKTTKAVKVHADAGD